MLEKKKKDVVIFKEAIQEIQNNNSSCASKFDSCYHTKTEKFMFLKFLNIINKNSQQD